MPIKKMHLFILATLLSLTVSLLSGCSNSVSVSDTDTGAITGQILTFSETAIPAARVYVADMYVSSNSDGWYILDNVPESDRVVVRIEKDGFIPSFKVIKVKKDDTTIVNARMLMQNRVHKNLDPGVDQTITDNQGEIVIPANGLTYEDSTDNEIFTGTYQCSITMIDPSLEHGKDIFPGEFKGLTLGSNEPVPLISYGFFNLTLHDNETDRELQLAAGHTAKVRIPIPAELQATAPSSMGFWSFNETEGMWHLEGTLLKNSGSNAYEGDVGHFSFFGTAEVYTPSYISGTILDCDENPSKNAEVIISGTDPFNSWRSVEISTPEDGYFNLPAYPNSNAIITVNQNGTSTNINEEISTPAPNNDYSMGGLIACASIKKAEITLTWNEHPRDLDAHLVIQPVSDSGSDSDITTNPDLIPPTHLWYKMSNVGHAKLLNDDIKGHGSETFEIYNLINGTYRFSVHHFAGSGSMAERSWEIEATIVIEEFGNETKWTERLRPPSEGNGVNDIWVVWDFVVSENKIIQLNDVNTISKVKNSIYP